MNYLAHAHLSFGNPEWVAGNFLADVIKGKSAIEELPPGIRQGVVIHRAIDTFTDSHPLVAQGRERLYASQGKYASVVIDVYYDFLLANHWHLYSTQSLEAFAQETYLAYRAHASYFPPLAWQRMQAMMEHNFLAGYGSEKALHFTFERLATRAHFNNDIANAGKGLLEHLPAFTEEFLVFYPQLIEMVKAL